MNEHLPHEPAVVDTDHLEPIMNEPIPGHIPVLRQLGVAFLLLVFVFSTSYVGTLMAVLEPEKPSDIAVSARLAESTDIVPFTNPFDTARIVGKSGFVWDVTEGRPLFDKNADEIRPLASITKLMTALVAYELLDDDTSINISVDAIRTDGDSGLKGGEVFSLKSLTDMVLVASSNDGAAALAAAAGRTITDTVSPEKIFVEAMNLRAEQLGLTNTTFKNSTGLDISSTEAGAYSTARDVALLLEYIITTYPQVASLTAADRARIFNATGEYHEVDNTNTIVTEIDGLLASKTGYTELAGGNLAVAFESGLNRPIVVVVLGSTFEARFTDVLDLSERARTYIATSLE